MVLSATKTSITYNETTMSAKIATWTNVPNGFLHVRENGTTSANVIYALAAINAMEQLIEFGEGGGESTLKTSRNIG